MAMQVMQGKAEKGENVVGSLPSFPSPSRLPVQKLLVRCALGQIVVLDYSSTVLRLLDDGSLGEREGGGRRGMVFWGLVGLALVLCLPVFGACWV